jgi:predicted dehydrogenase
VPVRIGIVGCGAIHSTHAQAIRRISQATLSGFFDVVPDRSQAASLAFGAPWYESLAALCASSDSLAVCVPSGLHGEVGKLAARHGVHLLVEKPIEVTIDAARGLVEACRLANVKLGVISQHRFAPDIVRLKEAIQAGELGELIEGDATIKWYRTQAYYDSGEWRGTWKLDGGGCLINQGVHYIDMIQWLMGGVSSVQAQVRTAAHRIEVEDVAAALVEFKNGAIGVIQGSTSFFPGFAERLEIHGKRGSVMIEGDRAKVWELNKNEGDDLSPYGRGVTSQPTPNIAYSDRLPEPPVGDPQDRWIEQHRLQIEDFVNAIIEDRDPFITGEMALEPLKVILAIYESARRGGERVWVPE